LKVTVELILWRHAEAEDGVPDGARALNKKGNKQAATLAAWLKPRLPEAVRILVSPATRAQQTAAALGLPFTTTRQIGVGAPASEVLAAAGWPDGDGTVMVVGHQPALGYAAALALTGAETSWTIKKGAIWWLTRRVRGEDGQTVLRAVIGPDLA
jgi:phosphohistidine phosphatase